MIRVVGAECSEACVLVGEELNGGGQSGLLLVGLELHGLQVAAVPLGLVADERRIEHARLNAQVGDIGGRERPLGEELDRLGLGQPNDEVRLGRPRAYEAVVLEGDHRTRIEAQSARVLAEVGQAVLGGEKLDHGDARGDVHGVDVVAVYERIERLADEVEVVGASLVVVAAAGECARRRRLLLLLLEEALEALDRLRTRAEAGERLAQVIAQHGQLGLGQVRYRVALAVRRHDARLVQVDEPNVVGQREVGRLGGEERGRHADEKGRGRQQQLLGLFHAARQQRYHREHVLERIEHGHEGHDAHGERVVVARLEEQLVLEQDEREHLDAHVDAEQLERQVQRIVDELEARVVRQREQHRRLVRQYVDLRVCVKYEMHNSEI